MRRRLAVTLAVLALLPCVMLSLYVGTIHISGSEILRQVPGVSSNIFWNVRLPRTLLAVMLGSGLALAGACYQGLLRNPLADPYILGVSSGASAGAVLAVLLKSQFISFYAFGGAAITIGLVMGLSYRYTLRGTTHLILAGVMINALFSAAVTFGMLLLGQSMSSVMFWLTGAIRPLAYPELARVALGWGLASASLYAAAPRLNVMLLGDEVARSLGVSAPRLRLAIFFISSLLIGLLVSKAGIIGFVGLIVPHLVRLWLGSDYRILLPVSFVIGAELVLCADVLARLLGGGEEFPIGVLMAFLGAPFFLWLLWRNPKT